MTINVDHKEIQDLEKGQIIKYMGTLYKIRSIDLCDGWMNRLYLEEYELRIIGTLQVKA